MAKVIKKQIYKIVIYPVRDPLSGKCLESETELHIQGTNAMLVETEIEAIFQVVDGRTIVFCIPSDKLIYCVAIDSVKKSTKVSNFRVV